MLQLSLTLANDLYELLAISGEPVDFLGAARKLLALKEAPASLCHRVMDSLVAEDGRFCWHSPQALGLRDWQEVDPDLKDVNFVVVDVETTGGRPGPAKITEIGAVRIEGLRVVSTFHSLINPQRPIPAKIIEITGITPDMVRGAPRIELLMPKVMDFMKDAVVVGHNIQFDLAFLNYELSRLDGRRLGEGAFDTLKLSRLLAPGLPNHRLATVAGALGSSVETFHRALADASATAHVFLTLVGRLQERGITQLNQARSFTDPLHKRDRHKLALTGHLPRTPGVYLFRDENDEVLYVGKADHLRDRVRSYFVSGPDHSRRIRQALRRLHHIDCVETITPLDAVVTEQDLILEHRPQCNTFGRNPERYVYLKAGGNHGLHIYASTSPSTRGAAIVMGPFRGKGRVTAAIELLTRCYPIRRCARDAGDPCLYGQTGRCLAPCVAQPDGIASHDALVGDLLRWVAGGMPERFNPSSPPEAAALALTAKLARQCRFEEAAEVKKALEDTMALRRSCRAVTEALSINAAVLWPDRTDVTSPRAHLTLIWEGSLAATLTVTPSTAALEIGRLVRTLDAPKPPQFPVAIPNTKLDPLLAVRRWLLENQNILRVPYRDPQRVDARKSLDAWGEKVLAAALALLITH